MTADSGIGISKGVIAKYVGLAVSGVVCFAAGRQDISRLDVGGGVPDGPADAVRDGVPKNLAGNLQAALRNVEGAP